MKVNQIDDTIQIARILEALEYEIRTWHTRLRAAQTLRSKYSKSDFAQKALKKEEKEFKKRWWKALAGYRKFKEDVGLC